MKNIPLLALLSLLCAGLYARQTHSTAIPFLEGEHWWGGAVAFGPRMPFVAPLGEFDLARDNHGNQTAPLLLSDKGRYVWDDDPFSFEISGDTLTLRSAYRPVEARRGGATLREAYLTASREHFPPSGSLPDRLLFTNPQYNTWIELMYDQNQRDVLSYAASTIDNGMPPGVLMIDDNWQKYYGNFEFKPDRFPDPKGMVDRLHRLGFKVMLWICPFVSPDSPEYRVLAEKGWLIRRKGSSSPAIIQWWNGQSACYDLTNPEALAHLTAALNEARRRYGIDGFKLDAGDAGFYDPNTTESHMVGATPTDHSLAWAKVGLEFALNEYRACWKMGGQALVQRLGDKDYSWEAVGLLIPGMTAAGLLGYPYACPDMIGGGLYTAFLNVATEDFDQALIVRSAQVHALMPMMQFSVAPWRVLDARHMEIVRRMARLHEKFGGYIMECARHASRTGEPIARHMEYAFPGEGFALCRDQFMLGDRYMVGPIVTPSGKRTVRLPRGRWRDDEGKLHKGGRTIEMDIPLERLAWFERIEN